MGSLLCISVKLGSVANFLYQLLFMNHHTSAYTNDQTCNRRDAVARECHLLVYQSDLIPIRLFNWHCSFTSIDVRSIAHDSSHPLAPCCRRRHCTLTLHSLLICHICPNISTSCSTYVSIRAHATAWLRHPPSTRCQSKHNVRFDGCFQRQTSIPFESARSIHSRTYKQ